MTAKIAMGQFLRDLHLSPDGQFGFIRERDHDPVSKYDVKSHKIVKRVDFANGSKPYMLRVPPDGKRLWVQATRKNSVLDPTTV